MMEITYQLKERFCKDCKIPINIFVEPYFTDRLMLYDDMYGSLEKWDRFLDGISKFDNEEQYFAHYNSVKDAMIDHIKSCADYVRFNEEDMNKFRLTNVGFPSKDIYKPSSSKRRFISIDMTQANFNALNYYSDSIFTVDGRKSSCWEDFVSNFTDNAHIISSKYIRQVVLGNCNPKRHITFQKWLMDKVLSEVMALCIGTVVSFCNDEIVLDVTDCYITEEVISKLRDIVDKQPIPMTLEYFELRQLVKGTEEAYIKMSLPPMPCKITLKCVPPHLLPLILRAQRLEPITDSDLTFMHCGLLARYIDTPLDWEGVLQSD